MEALPHPSGSATRLSDQQPRHPFLCQGHHSTNSINYLSNHHNHSNLCWIITSLQTQRGMHREQRCGNLTNRKKNTTATLLYRTTTCQGGTIRIYGPPSLLPCTGPSTAYTTQSVRDGTKIITLFLHHDFAQLHDPLHFSRPLFLIWAPLRCQNVP